jgi:hypothetical protein
MTPQYDFAVCGGTNPANLINVELLTAGGRFFAPPTLEGDEILLLPGSDGVPFERGYLSLIWKSSVYRAQYSYLYNTILGGARQGAVVIRTLRVMDDTTYSVYRGILTLPSFSGFQRNYTLYSQMPWTFTRLLRVT